MLDAAVDATNRSMLAVGSNNQLHLWSLRAGRCVRPYAPDRGSSVLHKVSIDPSGLFAAAADTAGVVRVWDYYSGSVLARIAAHADMVTGLMWSPDCKRLISTGADGCIISWKLAPELTEAMRERLKEIVSTRAQRLASRALAATRATLGVPRPADPPGVPSAVAPPAVPGASAAPTVPATSAPLPQLPPPSAGPKSAASPAGLASSALPVWAQSNAGPAAAAALKLQQQQQQQQHPSARTDSGATEDGTPGAWGRDSGPGISTLWRNHGEALPSAMDERDAFTPASDGEEQEVETPRSAAGAGGDVVTLSAPAVPSGNSEEYVVSASLPGDAGASSVPAAAAEARAPAPAHVSAPSCSSVHQLASAEGDDDTQLQATLVQNHLTPGPSRGRSSMAETPGATPASVRKSLSATFADNGADQATLTAMRAAALAAKANAAQAAAVPGAAAAAAAAKPKLEPAAAMAAVNQMREQLAKLRLLPPTEPTGTSMPRPAAAVAPPVPAGEQPQPAASDSGAGAKTGLASTIRNRLAGAQRSCGTPGASTASPAPASAVPPVAPPSVPSDATPASSARSSVLPRKFADYQHAIAQLRSTAATALQLYSELRGAVTSALPGHADVSSSSLLDLSVALDDDATSSAATMLHESFANLSAQFAAAAAGGDFSMSSIPSGPDQSVAIALPMAAAASVDDSALPQHHHSQATPSAHSVEDILDKYSDMLLAKLSTKILSSSTPITGHALEERDDDEQEDAAETAPAGVRELDSPDA